MSNRAPSETGSDVSARALDLSAEVKKVWGPKWNEPSESYVFGDRKFTLRTQDAPQYNIRKYWTSVATGEVWTAYANAGIVSGSDATPYLQLNGVSGNFASTPDASALDILGDLQIIARIAPANWRQSASRDIVSKFTGVSNQRSYRLRIGNGGLPALNWSTDGSLANSVNADATAAITAAAFQPLYLMATLDVDNDNSGNTTTFFTSSDGVTFTKLGSSVINSGVTSIFNSTATLNIGSISDGGSSLFNGNIYRAQIYNGINGTLVADMNPADWTA